MVGYDDSRIIALTGKGGLASSAEAAPNEIPMTPIFSPRHLANKIDRSRGVTTFQEAECDLFAGTFAVRLKIEQQHRVACL